MLKLTTIENFKIIVGKQKKAIEDVLLISVCAALLVGFFLPVTTRT